VLQPVPKHGRLWPEDQRFDYLVRLRPLSKQDLHLWQDRLKDFRTTPPQRESLLFALRELTGEDPGPSPEDWKRLYSVVTGQRLEKPLEAGDQVTHLTESLVGAPPVRQAELLQTYKDRRGPAYDQALARAIPLLTTDLQKMARSVLADRMRCLPLKGLRENFQDRAVEVRRAAVRACRLREEKALVPELIALLGDASEEVAYRAHEALRQFSNRDFGPPRGADEERRRQAMTAWRDWWEQHTGASNRTGLPAKSGSG
jgi:hypothetical protein